MFETAPNSGSFGDYIKITKLNIDKINGKLIVVLSLFTDAAHKDGSPIKPVFKVCNLNISASEYDNDMFATAYTKIKNQDYPELIGALDV